MKFTQPIVITTIDGDAELIRPKPWATVDEIKWDVKAAIIAMYERSEVVFEEFIECGEVQIDGLPLNMQVEIFCELKKEIDGDEIYIESSAMKAFPTMKLLDYLILGPSNGPEIPEKKGDDE